MNREISSIVRATKILRCLSNDIGKITEIANQLQLSKGSVHGILETLKKVGFAGQDPSTRQYCIGPLFHELTADPILSHKILILCSFSEMMRLRDLSQETVALMVPNGAERVILEEIPSPQAIKFAGGRKKSAQIYTGAGKVLLAQFEDKVLDAFFNSLDLLPVTKNTITDKDLLLQEVRKIRQQGYGTSFGERLPGCATLSVPIPDYHCPALLSIVGPEERFTTEKMRTILPDLKHSAIIISKSLKSFSMDRDE